MAAVRPPDLFAPLASAADSFSVDTEAIGLEGSGRPRGSFVLSAGATGAAARTPVERRRTLPGSEGFFGSFDADAPVPATVGGGHGAEYHFATDPAFVGFGADEFESPPSASPGGRPSQLLRPEADEPLESLFSIVDSHPAALPSSNAAGPSLGLLSGGFSSRAAIAPEAESSSQFTVTGHLSAASPFSGMPSAHISPRLHRNSGGGTTSGPAAAAAAAASAAEETTPPPSAAGLTASSSVQAAPPLPLPPPAPMLPPPPPPARTGALPPPQFRAPATAAGMTLPAWNNLLPARFQLHDAGGVSPPEHRFAGAPPFGGSSVVTPMALSENGDGDFATLEQRWRSGEHVARQSSFTRGSANVAAALAAIAAGAATASAPFPAAATAAAATAGPGDDDPHMSSISTRLVGNFALSGSEHPFRGGGGPGGVSPPRGAVAPNSPQRSLQAGPHPALLRRQTLPPPMAASVAPRVSPPKEPNPVPPLPERQRDQLAVRRGSQQRSSNSPELGVHQPPSVGRSSSGTATTSEQELRQFHQEVDVEN